MEDQTIGPILSWTTEAMLEHVEKLKKLPGASLAFGGEQLQGHSIPQQYGAITPTAVFVPLAEILKPENFELVTTEVFGPVQVLPCLPLVQGICLLHDWFLSSDVHHEPIPNPHSLLESCCQD